MAVAGVKYQVCDLVVQVQTQGEVNWERNMTFACFGLCYAGAAQYMIFNRIFPRILPGLSASRHGRSKGAIAAAALLDNFVHVPLLYMPAFYVAQQTAAHPEKSVLERLESARKEHRQNLYEDLVMQGSIMLPVQLANFAFNPPHLRVPTVVLAGVVWVTALSYMRGEGPEITTTVKLPTPGEIEAPVLTRVGAMHQPIRIDFAKFIQLQRMVPRSQ